MLVVLVVLAVVVTVGGCQSADAMRNDMVGALNFVGEKFLKPLSEKAQKRDAEISADKLATYHAGQAGKYASYAIAEVE
jgi:hypothetical protein